MVKMSLLFTKFSDTATGRSRFFLFVILAALLVSAIPFISAAADSPSGDQPYTFRETACTFIDTSELLFLSTPPDELGYRCGYVIVPLRHADPDGETIQLPVAILPASDPGADSEPLFVVQGGPGGSAFEIYPFILPGSPIAEQRDIVMINQRGTQFAMPELFCPETIGGLGDVLSLPEEEGIAIVLDQVRECRQRLASRGYDLSAFNSQENASDIEAIRQVLGYDSYNFYGVSYGSLLGLHLLRQHPDHLRSVILDGVLPADLSFIRQVPLTRDRAFQQLFDFCDQDPDCGADYPDLEGRLINLVETLDEQPVTLRLRDPDTGQVVRARMDGSTLIDLLFESFYLEHPYAILPYIITRAEAGDFLFLESFWSLVAFDRSFSEGMYHSVICAEEWQDDQIAPSLEGVRPYLARNAEFELQAYQDLCRIWDVNPLPGIVNQPVSSDTPTLLLSGRYDPITPPSFAARVAESLPNAYQVVDPVGSHGVAFVDACINQLIGGFLEHPDRQPDPGCLESPGRQRQVIPANAVSAPFLAPLGQLDPGFLSNLAVAAGLVFLALSAYLVWPSVWLIRLIRDRQLALDRRQKRVRWAGRIIVLVFGLLAVMFGIAMIAILISVVAAGNLSYLSVYALPGIARYFLVIPFILVALAVVAVLVSIAHWRGPAGPLWEKVYYSLLTLCAIGVVTIIIAEGFLIV
jgi:pimeloyl-ACP methyl ester carboxylesterase